MVPELHRTTTKLPRRKTSLEEGVSHSGSGIRGVSSRLKSRFPPNRFIHLDAATEAFSSQSGWSQPPESSLVTGVCVSTPHSSHNHLDRTRGDG